MAEPARKPPDYGTEPELYDDEGCDVVLRWVRAPGGRVEWEEVPLTPEYFLDPRHGDQVVQHPLHNRTCFFLYGLLDDYFSSQKDVLVLSDVKLLWGHRQRKRPGPDVMVIRGVRDRDRSMRIASFNVAREGVRPSLIIEVLSNSSQRIRKIDLVDKVVLYEAERIPEYLLLDLPQPETGDRFQWVAGYRLGADQKYRPIEPDGRGRFLSQTAGLRFGTSPDGQQVFVYEAATGRRLLTPLEIAAKARRQEAEVARLREELARLKAGRD